MHRTCWHDIPLVSMNNCNASHMTITGSDTDFHAKSALSYKARSPRNLYRPRSVCVKITTIGPGWCRSTWRDNGLGNRLTADSPPLCTFGPVPRASPISSHVIHVSRGSKHYNNFIRTNNGEKRPDAVLCPTGLDSRAWAVS